MEENIANALATSFKSVSATHKANESYSDFIYTIKITFFFAFFNWKYSRVDSAARCDDIPPCI